MKPSKLLPAFAAGVIFVTVLMVCLMSPPKGGNTETADTPVTPDKTSAEYTALGKHVFHSGELRGVWVPYFSISDGVSMSETEFKLRFDDIISTAKAHGVNTLFVHIRSHCDAAYPSQIFPFSEVYREGGSDPKYDPLEYMIDASHEAGLEFHAWLNPYRISSDGSDLPKSGKVAQWIESGSDNIIEYDGGLYLDPASSEVRSLIIAGVRELVGGYGVDGVHLDDYFYAFTETGADAPDYYEYLSGISPKAGALTIDEWRRANVNVLVSGIWSAVKEIDPQTLFGISPQGNIENDLSLGADVYTWCGSNGYIDYIAPQVYFSDENEVCPYTKTVGEWSGLVKTDGMKMYVGLALYKAGSSEYGSEWLDEDIIADQITAARENGADGFILYAFDYLDDPRTAAQLERAERLY